MATLDPATRLAISRPSVAAAASSKPPALTAPGGTLGVGVGVGVGFAVGGLVVPFVDDGFLVELGLALAVAAVVDVAGGSGSATASLRLQDAATPATPRTISH